MTILTGSQFQCANATCPPFITIIVSDIFDCQIACLSQFQCKATSFHQSTFKCDLFGDMWNQNGNMLADIDTITMLVIDGTRNPLG